VPRQKKITAVVLEQIPTLIKAGISSGEIADRIGCTLGTLRVVCSKAKISLRKSESDKPDRNHHADIPVALPGAMIAMFQREAGKRGLAVEAFVSMLLKVIAQDNLYEAVLDEREDHAGRRRARAS
jgi:hypothetical protein